LNSDKRKGNQHVEQSYSGLVEGKDQKGKKGKKGDDEKKRTVDVEQSRFLPNSRWGMGEKLVKSEIKGREGKDFRSKR